MTKQKGAAAAKAERARCFAEAAKAEERGENDAAIEWLRRANATRKKRGRPQLDPGSMADPDWFLLICLERRWVKRGGGDVQDVAGEVLDAHAGERRRRLSTLKLGNSREADVLRLSRKFRAIIKSQPNLHSLYGRDH